MDRVVLLRFGLVVALAAMTVPARAEAPAEIEIYQGTRKVSPLPKPMADPVAAPKAVAAVATTLHSATAVALESTSNAVGRLLERSWPKWEAPRFPVVVNVTLPPTPAPAAPIISASAMQPAYLPWVRERPEPREEAKPTVIVLREPAPAPVMPDVRAEPPTVRISNEVLMLVATVFGGAMVLTILAYLLRSRPVVERPSIVTIDGLSAGVLSSGPEKFEVGPTFAEEQAAKHEASEAAAAAMVQQILDENMSLRTEIAKA